MKLPIKIFLASTLLCALSPTISGDVLLLDAIAEEPLNNAQHLPRPERFMSMDQVRERFGEPANALPWVGDPPITRWVYERYTVYFEHDRVINSVVHR